MNTPFSSNAIHCRWRSVEYALVWWYGTTNKLTDKWPNLNITKHVAKLDWSYLIHVNIQTSRKSFGEISHSLSTGCWWTCRKMPGMSATCVLVTGYSSMQTSSVTGVFSRKYFADSSHETRTRKRWELMRQIRTCHHDDALGRTQRWFYYGANGYKGCHYFFEINYFPTINCLLLTFSY